MNKLILRDRLLDFFFPQVTCLLCGGAENVEDGFCMTCVGQMERYRDHAPDCISCYAYEDKVRAALRLMKFRGQFDLPVRFFGAEMAKAVKKAGWRVEVVVPVPAEPRAERRRGYNQSEKLARRVVQLLNLPLETKALRKKRGTRSQVGLTEKQRLENIKGSILPGRAKIMGKTVLLVDDLMTTGATVNECRKVLLESGAKAIYIVTAAHAVRNPDYKDKITD